MRFMGMHITGPVNCAGTLYIGVEQAWKTLKAASEFSQTQIVLPFARVTLRDFIDAKHSCGISNGGIGTNTPN